MTGVTFLSSTAKITRMVPVRRSSFMFSMWLRWLHSHHTYWKQTAMLLSVGRVWVGPRWSYSFNKNRSDHRGGRHWKQQLSGNLMLKLPVGWNSDLQDRLNFLDWCFGLTVNNSGAHFTVFLQIIWCSLQNNQCNIWIELSDHFNFPVPLNVLKSCFHSPRTD